MNFARPDLLPFVLIVPALLMIAIALYARRRQRLADAFSDPHLLPRLGGAALLRFPTTRLVLIAAAGACLAVAAAGPQWGLRATEGRALSLNIVIAADISKSMLAEDVSPNRLERARLFARRMLRDLAGDRFGLVVFAGRAYVLSPLTVDRSAMELYLDALDPNMVSQGGSSLAAAITQATDLVRGAEEAGGDRAIVLISDGEALEEADAVRAAADRASSAGVRIIAVGVGTAAGANIPDVDEATGAVLGLKRDEYGDVVVSRLDEQLLRSVADRTDGMYVRMDDAASIDRVVAELRRMQRAEGDNEQRLEPRERFAFFAALALLLLLIDVLLFGPIGRAGTAAPVAAMRAPPGTQPPGTHAPDTNAPGTNAVIARGRRRRTPARVALLLLITLAVTGQGIGELERGNRMYREGRYEEAAEAYRRVVDAGDATPQVHYNLGTALLALGQYEEAGQQLEAALRGVEPELRQRALYNLGNRFLADARSEADVARQGALLDAAIEAYRRSLRVQPEDVDAKWNLEMALRDRDENEQRQQSMPQQQDQDEQEQNEDEQQQGGGTGGSGSDGQAGDGQDQGASTQHQPMSQEEADRILNAMEQDERELTRERLRRGQQRVPVLRDW